MALLPGNTEERHWFQVNGIHLKDNPTWRVSSTPADDDEYPDIPF